MSILLRIAAPSAALLLAACASAPAPQGSPAPTAAAPSCAPITEAQVAALFDRWNASLATGDAHQVVSNYALRSILLPTVSNKPRLTPEEKEDYFHHFLQNKPSGRIDQHFIQLGCNTALDAGLYTFTFGTTGAQVKARFSYTYEYQGGQWLITSHHSSAMPEK